MTFNQIIDLVTCVAIVVATVVAVLTYLNNK